MREESDVYECRRVPVAPLLVSGARGGVRYDHALKPVLQQVAQVRLHTDVGQHASENDLADAAFAQLQDEVVGLRSPDLVRTHDDGLPILDVWLEALEPVRPGSREAIEGECSHTSEGFFGKLARLQWIVELPPAVRRIEVVWRDEDAIPVLLRRPEDALHVVDRPVLRDALTNRVPGGTPLAQDIILRIDEDDSGVIRVELHSILRLWRACRERERPIHVPPKRTRLRRRSGSAYRSLVGSESGTRNRPIAPGE